MRTTVAIDDVLLDRAKERAAERRLTLGQFVEEALAQSLSAPRSSRASITFPVFVKGTGPASGVDLTTNAAVLDAADAADLAP